MGWVIWTSFRRNWFRYWLAILGLAAAVAVAGVGISGSALMWRMAKYPVLQVIGGDWMVVDQKMSFYGGGGSLRSNSLPQLLAYSELRELVASALPQAEVSGTLIVPAVQESRSQVYTQPVFGRDDQLTDWMYSVSLLQGEGLPDANDPRLRILVQGYSSGLSRWGEGPGERRTIRLPVLDAEGEWAALASGAAYPCEIAGTYRAPSHGQTLMQLGTLQRLTGAEDRISWLGVAAPNPLMLAESEERLRQAVASQRPDLQVLSAEDLGRVMLADFDRLEQTATYYTPVMIMVSVLVVVVTALAISQSRRRELVLLRTLGVAGSQVRALFVLECTAVAVCGAVAGTLAAVVLGAAFFQAYVINLWPGLAATAVTVLVTSLVAGGRRGRQFAEQLRNP